MVKIQLGGQLKPFIASNSKTHSVDFKYFDKDINKKLQIEYSVERPTLAGGEIIIRVRLIY